MELNDERAPALLPAVCTGSAAAMSWQHCAVHLHKMHSHASHQGVAVKCSSTEAVAQTQALDNQHGQAPLYWGTPCCAPVMSCVHEPQSMQALAPTSQCTPRSTSTDVTSATFSSNRPPKCELCCCIFSSGQLGTIRTN